MKPLLHELSHTHTQENRNANVGEASDGASEELHQSTNSFSLQRLAERWYEEHQILFTRCCVCLKFM